MRLWSVSWLGSVLSAFLTLQTASACLAPPPALPNPFDRPHKVQPYIIDDETEVILDGVRVEWKDLPASGTEVIEMVLWRRHVDKIELRTKK